MTKRIDRASKLVRASAASVYGALMTADARRQWLPPDGMRCAIDAFDPRVGGGYRMTLTYVDAHEARGKSSADSDVVQARFLELVPDQRVVEAIEFAWNDAAFAGTMRMSWTLVAAPDGTEVTVTAEDVPEGIAPGDHELGMRSSLENLAAFVEREGPARPASEER